MFLSSYRNATGSLGEREMRWEHEPQDRPLDSCNLNEFSNIMFSVLIAQAFNRLRENENEKLLNTRALICTYCSVQLKK